MGCLFHVAVNSSCCVSTTFVADKKLHLAAVKRFGMLFADQTAFVAFPVLNLLQSVSARPTRPLCPNNTFHKTMTAAMLSLCKKSKHHSLGACRRELPIFCRACAVLRVCRITCLARLHHDSNEGKTAHMCSLDVYIWLLNFPRI